MISRVGAGPAFCTLLCAGQGKYNNRADIWIYTDLIINKGFNDFCVIS